MHHYRFENKLTRALFSRISSNSSSSSNTSVAHKGGNDPREERRGEGGRQKRLEKEREKRWMAGGWSTLLHRRILYSLWLQVRVKAFSLWNEWSIALVVNEFFSPFFPPFLPLIRESGQKLAARRELLGENFLILPGWNLDSGWSIRTLHESSSSIWRRL